MSAACVRPGAPAAAADTVAPTGLVSAASESGARRAIWIWERDSFRILDDPAFQEDVLGFLSRENVKTLYLYADSFRGRNILRDEPEKYRAALAGMHRRGFEVYALLGSKYLNTPEYILPGKRAVAVRMFRAVLEFNATDDTAARFDGVNIDIEPYLLDDWNARRTQRMAQYLDLTAEFMRLKRAAGSTILVGPAMPFWFDGIEEVTWNGSRKRLSEHVQDLTDYVAIMDYRNFAEGRDGIIAHASDELDYADSHGRLVVIGLETLRTQPAKVTFFGTDRATLEQEMRRAEGAFARHRSFRGFALHHLASYRALVESTTESLDK